ncbi:hypothetical protein HDV00_002948 [Rhizophlyctis rosea]|nr:hypothetical protein HDV00_002948 [Rhizophlyctis rosea]
MAAAKKTPRIIVLGAGVIGLTIANLLQSRGYQVTIVARAFPDNPDELYTSAAAGAHWRSYASKDEHLLQEWEETTLRMFFRLADFPATGIHICPGVEIWKQQPESWQDPWFSGLVPNYTTLASEQLPPGAGWGVKYQTICINVPVYLKWLLSSFREGGGAIDVREIGNIEELFDGKTDFVVNCTGYGARSLKGVEDGRVYPTRGQTVIVRAPKVNLTITTLGGTADDFSYVIPRGDGTVVLGGTYEANNSDLQPDETVTRRIIERCVALVPEVGNSAQEVEVICSKVGLRPTRVGGVRLDYEDVVLEKGKLAHLIHCYGHGGYGYQSSYGSALAVAQMVYDLESQGHGTVWRKIRQMFRPRL